jgi:hypothetical protein
MNISILKKELEQVGVATATPGLSGESRFLELQSRLEAHKKANNPGTEAASSFVVPSLNHLTIAEIKSRLSALGENTNTPGLSGEKRRNELMKRLVEGVCGNDDMMDNLVDEMVSLGAMDQLGDKPSSDKLVSYPLSRKPPSEAPPDMDDTNTTAAPSPKATAKVTTVPPKVIITPPSPPAIADINELKRDLKRLTNKRAMYVAARLSGSSQDGSLREK